MRCLQGRLNNIRFLVITQWWSQCSHDSLSISPFRIYHSGWFLPFTSQPSAWWTHLWGCRLNVFQAVRQYIVEHKLEKVVTSALNHVILQMPEAVSIWLEVVGLVWVAAKHISISIPINSKMFLLHLFLFVMLVAFCCFFFRIAPFMDNLICFTLRTSTPCMGLVFVLCTGTQGLASRIRLR